VIVASVAAKTLGNFLESQMHPKFNGDIGFIDRNGTIIYSSDQSFIGVDFFGNDFQSYMKSILKDREEGFNDIINRAMKSENGVQEFKFENSTTTIAYQAVNVPNRDESSTRIGTLFITVPHILSVEVISLIDTLILVNFSIILVIASISLIVAIMLLHWNKMLKENVSQKTTQLSESVGKLEQANEDLKTHDKLQREFINIAAHELRTPTQAISGNLDLIEIMHIPSIMQNTGHNENELRKEFQEILEDKEKLADFIRGLQSTY
jgi:signal transduction histidine kinase